MLSSNSLLLLINNHPKKEKRKMRKHRKKCLDIYPENGYHKNNIASRPRRNLLQKRSHL